MVGWLIGRFSRSRKEVGEAISGAIELAGLAALLTLLFLGSCTWDDARRYAYLYCKVRDADPMVHQTIDSMVPIAGPIANVTVSTGCVVIESYSAKGPAVTAVPAGSTVTVPAGSKP